MNQNIKALYSRNGRVKNKNLIDLINSLPSHHYCAMVPHPMLVSRKLYDGQMDNVGNGTNTMLFNVAAIRDQVVKQQQNLNDTVSQNGDENYNSAIFALFKSPDSVTAANMFSVGRVIPSDIVIPDFTISKKHAIIKFSDNKYFCTDLGSTNGTLVAGKILKKNESQVIHPNDLITFGRLGFIFLPPAKIYELLRN